MAIARGAAMNAKANKRPARPQAGHAGLKMVQSWLLSTRAVDPYTLWALQTGLRQFMGPDGKLPDLDFMLELDAPYAPGSAAWQALHRLKFALVPGIYRRALPGSDTPSRFVTLRLSTRGLNLDDVEGRVHELMFLKGVERIQIGFPRPPQRDSSAPRSGASQRIRWHGPRPPTLVLGVMEDACPFAHAGLANGWQSTRVAAIWDQSSARPGKKGHGRAPAQLGYGTQLLQAQLNRLLSRHGTARGVDEQAVYADPQSRQPLLVRGRGSHAAAVYGLLAGARPHVPSHRSAVETSDEGPVLPCTSHSASPATEAPIVAVQFPIEEVTLAGGRWLSVRALDGLRYLVDASRQLAPPGKAPLPMVVNLSYGSVAGAHDGTALLECAMDELCEKHTQLALVVAAGNAGGTRRDALGVDNLAYAPSGAHAHHHLPPQGKVEVSWLVPPNKPIESYLELWFNVPDLNAGDAPYLGRDEVRIQATSPIGETLLLEQCPGMAFNETESRKTHSGLLMFPRVSQSQRSSMALLVVSATQISSTRIEAPAGVWRIQVTNLGPRHLQLDAWVERDVIPRGERRGQAARLIGNADGSPDGLTDDNTLNNIGTGNSVFRVGALMSLRDGTGSLMISPYSSTAAPQANGLEYSAVADGSTASPGVRVSGNLSGTVLRMNGTSVAAPQAARRLADFMGSGKPLTQVRRALSALPSGPRRGKVET